ncbi:uncharacterized protein [Haliotis cracherodii]|uniref:uncharacterized protein LOC124115367 n=1 Tax=Haliotis rufescens TaxID=6454 RepID=UPI001EAF9437|nr:uncharacterized protein LOC124115367 [Haliotis rufescens]
MAVPVFYTPLTKAQLGFFSHQKGPCANFEMDFFRCASRVGQTNSVTVCHKELDDFAECTMKKKEFERYVIMQKERKKQGRPYAPTPAPDVAGIVN